MSLAVNHRFDCASSRGVASFARSGGGGAKFKSGGKGVRRNSKTLSGRNHKFTNQKQVISKKKKKVFAEIQKYFLAEIANFNVFSAQKHQLLPPIKIPWEGKKKIGGGGKNENRGSIAPLPPRWRRAWLLGTRGTVYRTLF